MTARARRLVPALFALLAAPAPAEPPQLGLMSGVPAATAVLLARGGEGGPLPIAAGVFPLDLSAAPSRALVVVEVDGRTLAAAAPGPRAGVEIHLYVVSADGGVVSTRSEAVAIDLADHGGRLAAGGLRWIAAVELPAAARRLRLHVREHFSGAFGQREIGLGDDGPPGVATDAAPLPWIEVASASLVPEDLALLEAIGGAPAAVPAFVGGSSIRVARWRAPADEQPLPLRLCDAAGRTLSGLTPRIEGSSSFAPRLVVDRYTVDLPLEPSGRLGFAWGPGEPARVLVRAGEALAWNRMPAVDLPAARTAETSTARGGAGRGRVEQARAARLAVASAWRRYADGDRDGAVAELLEVDSGLETRRRGSSSAVEGPAIERLTERDPALLLPISVLYLDLERAALAAGRLPVARRARELAEDLAGRLAAGASDSAPRRRVAAALLEALAADRIEARDSAAAAALLERSARLAPDRAAPWLTIGILYERDRVLDRARAAFDRVLAVEPGHREARLRRARVDLLAGSAAAGAELERLASENLDWIGVVAAEERTRQLFAEGRDEAAIELLGPLVEAAPREASLQRALAYALERSGRRLAAREHVARATAATARPGTSPRKRYAEAPERLLLDRRVEVERAALLALPDLAAALAAEEGAR